jgi:hypothetical protein
MASQANQAVYVGDQRLLAERLWQVAKLVGANLPLTKTRRVAPDTWNSCE